MQETRVRSLGWENPLEKEMATYTSILAWEIPLTEEPGGLQTVGSQRVRCDLATKQQQCELAAVSLIFKKMLWILNTWWNKIQYFGTWCGLFTFMHWRRKWQPTPVFLPGESQGWGSLVGCRLWGLTESDMTARLHFHALEKEMATHSSVLAWRIPGTGEPGGLPSMGSHRLRHDWSDSAAAAVPFLKIIFYWRIISLKNFVVFLSNLNINQP